MSERSELESAKQTAVREWAELQKTAADAKKAPKLVRSGRAAVLRQLADSKGEQVFSLQERLDSLPPEGPPNLIEKEDGRLLILEENEVEASKPWWRFW